MTYSRTMGEFYRMTGKRLRHQVVEFLGVRGFDDPGGRNRWAWTSVITSKAANSYHFKTGQRKWPSGTRLFYPAASCGGKSIFVRQLRGPHLSTCPWCSKRSSMALTAAASPSSLPQSSTGRLEVSMVLARS